MVSTVELESTRPTVTGQFVLNNIKDKPNQLVLYNFPKRKFGQAKSVFRSVQLAWFKKWPWLHYDQVEDRMFYHTCCLAMRQGMTTHGTDEKKDIFLAILIGRMLLVKWFPHP